MTDLILIFCLHHYELPLSHLKATELAQTPRFWSRVQTSGAGDKLCLRSLAAELPSSQHGVDDLAPSQFRIADLPSSSQREPPNSLRLRVGSSTQPSQKPPRVSLVSALRRRLSSIPARGCRPPSILCRFWSRI